MSKQKSRCRTEEKKDKAAPPSPQAEPPVFRTARELLHDYVTGKLAEFSRPTIICAHERKPSMWACVEAATATSLGESPVCEFSRFNFWFLSRMGIFERADLSRLFDLGRQLECFLIHCALEREIFVVGDGDFFDDDSFNYYRSELENCVYSEQAIATYPDNISGGG